MKTINTSFIERMNLTMRHIVSRLHRKTLCFTRKGNTWSGISTCP
ncbi:MAG: IS1 family transposase [Desulfobacteria bacterium]